MEILAAIHRIVRIVLAPEDAEIGNALQAELPALLPLREAQAEQVRSRDVFKMKCKT